MLLMRQVLHLIHFICNNFRTIVHNMHYNITKIMYCQLYMQIKDGEGYSVEENIVHTDTVTSSWSILVDPNPPFRFLCLIRDDSRWSRMGRS